MRGNELYLRDIVEAADAVSSFISGNTVESLSASDLLLSAVQMKLAIIGEAVSHLPKDLREKYPVIARNKVAAYRNFAIHAYFAVSPRVWDTATIHAPTIRLEVSKILAAEFPA